MNKVQRTREELLGYIDRNEKSIFNILDFLKKNVGAMEKDISGESFFKENLKRISMGLVPKFHGYERKFVAKGTIEALINDIKTIDAKINALAEKQGVAFLSVGEKTQVKVTQEHIELIKIKAVKKTAKKGKK